MFKMEKVRKLLGCFALLFLFQRTVPLLTDEIKLGNVFISAACESHLKCVFDNTNARGFCGIIPAPFFLGHKNVTLKYQNVDSKGKLIVVWQKLCDNIVDENLSTEGLRSRKGLLENQLFASTKFNGSRTSEDICGKRSMQYFMSINDRDALNTCCSNGVHNIMVGLPSKCIGEETFSDESCGKGVLMELINRFHLTAEGPDQQETVTNRNYYINIDEYLAEINRQTIQQMLNSCWREKILDSEYDSGTLVFTLPRLKSKIYVNHVNLNSLSRFNGYGSVLFVQNEPTRYEETITDPVKLLDVLKEELISAIDPISLNKLYIDLNSHILNAVLVNWQRHEVKDNLWYDREQIYNHLIPNEPSDYSYKFDKFVSKGHPYYPFAKSRVGFSIQDIVNYSSDFQRKIFLMLAAVHKNVVSVVTNMENFDYRNWFAKHFPEEWNHWVCALNTKGVNEENYNPLPIHPWQVTHMLGKMFVDLVHSEMLIPLEVRIEASPTSSMRSLLPMKNLSAPYIKVPVSIHATSSLRSYPSDIVKTAPILSHLMAEILSHESSIAEKLNIMREDIGLYLHTIEEERAEHLTVTFRENMFGCCLRGKEIAVSVAALFETFSATDTSLFIYVMQFAGYTTLKRAIQYFTKYVDLVIGSYLDLYLVYGIALEGHQQNTFAVFENGYIKRFIAKDLTGIKISATVSESHDLLRNISVSSFFKKHDEFFVRTRLLHTVYQMHLGELLVLVADHFSCSEKLFWDIIRDKTKQRFEALKERVDSVRWRNEYDAILKADWPSRSYLQNRFENNAYVEKNLHHILKNPLN